jgi:mRNA interferase RelE/StbE
MTYELKFIPSAKKEWDKLDHSIKQMFKKALAKRLLNQFVPAAKLASAEVRCTT